MGYDHVKTQADRRNLRKVWEVADAASNLRRGRTSPVQTAQGARIYMVPSVSAAAAVSAAGVAISAAAAAPDSVFLWDFTPCGGAELSTPGWQIPISQGDSSPPLQTLNRTSKVSIRRSAPSSAGTVSARGPKTSSTPSVCLKISQE